MDAEYGNVPDEEFKPRDSARAERHVQFALPPLPATPPPPAIQEPGLVVEYSEQDITTAFDCCCIVSSPGASGCCIGCSPGARGDCILCSPGASGAWLMCSPLTHGFCAACISGARGFTCCCRRADPFRFR